MCSGSDNPIEIRPQDLDGPLPFHLVVDDTMSILSAGRSIRRSCPELKRGDSLSRWITLERPESPIECMEDIHAIKGRLVLMRLAGCGMQLRGAFLPLHSGGGALLSAEPQLTSPDDLTRHDLHITDFAVHDAVTDLLFAIRARDLTLAELKTAMERQRVLVRELDHRVKNNIAAVLSLSSLTASDASSVEDYHQKLDRRVRALNESHTLLARSGWGPVQLELLANAVLNAFCDGSSRLRLSGEPIRVPARYAGPLALSLHELGINAAKYGAWSCDNGHVILKWTARDDTLHMTWTEVDGLPPEKIPSEGIGLTLVRGFIEHELDGAFVIDLTPTGLRFSIAIPVG